MSSAAPQRDRSTATWWFVVDLPRVDGRRRQAKRRGFKTKAEAQAALDDVRVSGRKHTYVAPTNETLSEFLDEWIESVRPALELSTHESYERNLRLHVKPRVGGLRLQQVDVGTLNRLYAALLADGRRNGSGGLSPRTVRYIHTIVQAALGAAVKWDRLVRNPADAAEPPSARMAKRSVMRTWSADEVARFLQAERDNRYHTVWTFLATTGCRRGEALGLRWEDVDLVRSRATIRQTITSVKGKIHRSATTKTGSLRVIQLDSGTIAALKTWKRRQANEKLAAGASYADEGLVFCHPDGRPFQPSTFSWMFCDRVKRHGLPRIRLHDLRHTWATLALVQGVHPRIVQERLGHSSISVTLDTYSHVPPILENDAAERIARLMLGQPAS